ncbi:MAG: hypothetical protein R3F09_08400 [Burkholderiaceae bacterium]|uniref:hypothetical protein n=1 Tax=Ottowia sp. TaxID=1898956 RepID=UPI00262C3F93|nr:hypothetical protein [Ottowia sp.]
MARATVIVTIDNEREVVAVNAWFQRWGPRIRCADNQGCGCCVDIWDVEAPAEALAQLPSEMWSPSAVTGGEG